MFLLCRDHCVSEGSHTIDGKTIEIRLSDSNQAKKTRLSGFSDPRNGGGADEGGAVDMEDVKFRRLFVGWFLRSGLKAHTGLLHCRL